jgi:hypothetical protein
MYIIEFDLFTMTFLSMEKPNKEWIVVPTINNVAFVIYATIQSYYPLFVFLKQFWMVLMICVFLVFVTTPTYYDFIFWVIYLCECFKCTNLLFIQLIHFLINF